MGGDHDDILFHFLEIIKNENLKTALYTGSESVDKKLLSILDYLKIGPYIESLGGLDSKKTNQKLIHVPSLTLLRGNNDIIHA